eukprot:evm.model.scf_1175.1 EVM.evm.TU.scf_1175.1   scf_1175:1836-2480(-)
MAGEGSQLPGGFLPFLPGDNDASADPDAEEAIEAMNEDMRRLLLLEAADFWSVVRDDPSLVVAIDTYLRFRRRAFDGVPKGGSVCAKQSRASQELA